MGFMPPRAAPLARGGALPPGPMNLIVNSGRGVRAGRSRIAALALRVRDAGFAYPHRSISAPGMPTHAAAMELNIPGIHGVGDSLIYFVDRYRDFSIYDVDFVSGARQARARARRPALVRRGAGDPARSHARTGSTSTRTFSTSRCSRTASTSACLPKGTLLESPCHKFYLQLIEPPPGAEDIRWDEQLVRVGLGAPDVPTAVQALMKRGVTFVDRGSVQPSEKGALTQPYLGGATFELVVSKNEP
jgi:4-hydroxyphenylpyruvate dioxygenase